MNHYHIDNSFCQEATALPQRQQYNFMTLHIEYVQSVFIKSDWHFVGKHSDSLFSEKKNLHISCECLFFHSMTQYMCCSVQIKMILLNDIVSVTIRQ